ncbi:hypothetical protein F3Y22_tig00110410pilonHSYRG00018 [Hibiscus syriacus]|uniref:Uncharacterized protein n=1 Tax=Hibiscus syriacus TaxID=106335 RepID=A0A6A3ASW6_HIBSY|nr:hypothetical protein F3Y22_tig00110410pilonHSYRG00018 [Hibiscus syriacus]
MGSKEINRVDSRWFGFAQFIAIQSRSSLSATSYDEEVQSAKAMLGTWKSQSQSLRMSIKNANMQAKDNMRKTALKEGTSSRYWRRIHGLSVQFANEGWNDIYCRKHHRESLRYPSIDGSGG